MLAMKNKAIFILIAITLIFAAYAAGFYTGRNTGNSPVLISTLPQTLPATTLPSHSATQASSGKININTATIEELDTLPKIGPKLAQRIINYRLTNGHFRSIEELTNVEGIGNGILDTIREYITI